MKNVAELINVVVHSLAFAAAFGAVIATTCIADATEIRRDAQGRVLGTARADSTGRITCRDSQGRQKRPSTTDSNPKWRQGDFAGKLYRQLVEGDGNLAFSPYGVASVCALLGIGAKGETADAFRNALELSTNKPDEVARIFREAKQDLCNAVEISDSVGSFKGSGLVTNIAPERQTVLGLKHGILRTEMRRCVRSTHMSATRRTARYQDFFKSRRNR